MNFDAVLINKDLALEQWRSCLNDLKDFTLGSPKWKALNTKQLIFAALLDGNIEKAMEHLAAGKKLLTNNDKKEIINAAPVLEGKQNKSDKVV